MIELRGVGSFGKLPSAGDFQRHGIDAPWGRRLFDWCVDGWSQALASGQVRDLDGPLWLLVRLDAPGHFAAMVLHPSRDRVGRRFPFVVLAELAAPGAPLGAVVLGAAKWLQAAAPVAGLAPRGLDAAVMRANVDALRTREIWRDAALAEDREAHARWRRETPATGLRPADATGDLAQFVRALEFARSPAGTPEYVVRGECAASPDALAATVDLFAAVGAAPVTALACEGDGARFRWRLLCDQLGKRYLRPLFWHGTAGDLVWDIVAERALPPSFSGRLARVDTATASVEDLIQAASHGPS